MALGRIAYAALAENARRRTKGLDYRLAETIFERVALQQAASARTVWRALAEWREGQGGAQPPCEDFFSSSSRQFRFIDRKPPSPDCVLRPKLSQGVRSMGETTNFSEIQCQLRQIARADA